MIGGGRPEVAVDPAVGQQADQREPERVGATAGAASGRARAEERGRAGRRGAEGQAPRGQVDDRPGEEADDQRGRAMPRTQASAT